MNQFWSSSASAYRGIDVNNAGPIDLNNPGLSRQETGMGMYRRIVETRTHPIVKQVRHIANGTRRPLHYCCPKSKFDTFVRAYNTEV